MTSTATQSTDISGSGVTIKITTASETLTIEPDVLVSSTSDNAIEDSTAPNFELINEGSVSGQNAGVFIQSGGFGTVVNATGTSLISGKDYGVDIAGPASASIVNRGSIIAYSLVPFSFGVAISGTTIHSSLVNSGYINADHAGVSFLFNLDDTTFDNSGKVRSAGTAVDINDASAAVKVTINNRPSGVIDGGVAAISVETGTLDLINRGTIIGTINCSLTSGNQVIVNHGKISGEVLLGGGGDRFNGSGGTSGEIVASGGNARIIAGKGNVSIVIEGGSDRLTAGPGHDRFFFQFAPSSAGPIETITNFNVHADKIVLPQSGFAGIGPVGHPLAAADFHVGAHAKTMSQHIVYNAANGFLFYDPDGRGAQPQVHFATLSPHLALAPDDFLVW